MNELFEDKIQKILYQTLLEMKEVDEQLPNCPDVEGKWGQIATSYIPDGAREFRNFPIASLGWMMYLGMAVAEMWDDDWTIYSQIENLYVYLRDKRGYDLLDEYICEEVLRLTEKESSDLETLVGECAARIHASMMRDPIEPGTSEAFDAYVFCLHQLYKFGAAMQLKRMGYHMEKM